MMVVERDGITLLNTHNLLENDGNTRHDSSEFGGWVVALLTHKDSILGC